MAIVWCEKCLGIIQSTESAGGKICTCPPVFGPPVNQAPIPDWNKMFPNINEKYSDLLQSHSSLCGEIEQKSAYIRELSDALEGTRKERDAALLQIGDMTKDRDEWRQQWNENLPAKQFKKERDDALRLNDNMTKTLDHLFSDPAIHPVVMRRFVGNSQEGVPTIDEGIQKCKHCVDALLAVSEAYFALKRKCDCSCHVPAPATRCNCCL